MMLLWVLLLLYTANANEWILYSTDKTYGDYDCLFYDSRFFCRRPNDSLIIRESVCNGTVWPMRDLKRNNVTTDMLFNWLHPHDNVERYARFLQRSSENDFILENETLCNCSSNNFGVDCSYERAIESTIEEVLLWQLSRPLDRNMQIIVCFVDGIQCNIGLLCLEWRQVCDGIMQCEDGIDEANCHMLEFHRCASNEFQCHNGMCIPQEFLFDGTLDCMDKSDEQETEVIFSYIITCPTKSKYDCDEQSCKKNEFACGDGQCIHWTNLINYQQSCQNRRNTFYRCELLTDASRPNTLDSGVCRTGWTSSALLPSCTTSLQYLLKGNDRKVSYAYVVANCPSLIPFPSSSIFTSNLKFFYNKSFIASFYDPLNVTSFGKSISPFPHLVCLTGSLTCNGSKITLNSDYCFDYDKFLALTIYPFFPISHIFCNIIFNISLK
jgi:hypothetical protein